MFKRVDDDDEVEDNNEYEDDNSEELLFVKDDNKTNFLICKGLFWKYEIGLSM